MTVFPFLRGFLAVAAVLWGGGASAQDFPSRPVAIVVGNPAGGEWFRRFSGRRFR